MNEGLTIGQVARLTGLTVDTIRYYEKRGLIPPPPRRHAWHGPGHRRFPPSVVDRLRFIKKAQHLGFTLNEIRDLLSLRDNPLVDRNAVRQRVEIKLNEIKEKIQMLEALYRALEQLHKTCLSAREPCVCPIIEALNEPEPLPLTRPPK